MPAPPSAPFDPDALWDPVEADFPAEEPAEDPEPPRKVIGVKDSLFAFFTPWAPIVMIPH